MTPSSSGGYQALTLGVIPNSLKVEDFSKSIVTLYPNPVTEVLYVKTGMKEGIYSIYNEIGQRVKTDNLSVDGAIPVFNLSKGVYYLQINQEKATKFIKN